MIEAQPSGNDEIADWIELVTLASGERGFNNHQLETWALEWAGISQVAFSLGLKTLERREQSIKKYPFRVNEFAVTVAEDFRYSPYSFLLVLSRPSNLMHWQNPTPSSLEVNLFEEFVAEAMVSYLGQNAVAIPFGWPSKHGRPQQFSEALIWLAEKMNVSIGTGFRPPRRKDGGVDVIAWKPFDDRRTGFPVFLVQCTLQQNYVSKSRDVDLRLWAGWLALERDPITVLAIPKAVPNDEYWNEASANSVMMERVRLVNAHEAELSLESSDLIKMIFSKIRDEMRH